MELGPRGANAPQVQAPDFSQPSHLTTAKPYTELASWVGSARLPPPSAPEGTPAQEIHVSPLGACPMWEVPSRVLSHSLAVQSCLP